MGDEIAKQWIDVAYQRWLFNCEYTSNLRKPTTDIVLQMRSAVDHERIAEAEQYMERLQSLSVRFSQNHSGSSRDYAYEQAETLVECGYAAYRMGEKLKALRLFDEASKKYVGQEHCRGAVLWMLGAVQWLYSARMDDAIVSWESSYEIYSLLRTRSNRVENAAWYRYWVEKMRDALDKAILEDYQAPPLQSEWPLWDNLSKPPKPNPNDTASSNHSRQGSMTDILQTISVYASIPAGGFSTSPQPETWIEMEQVLIDGIPHNIFSLNPGRVVKLGDDEHYVAVKVTGDSMNRKKIEDGDYVLLRVQQVADNGDIVAAEKDDGFSDNKVSTLKQFFRRNGEIHLEPQSSNPEHQTFVFANEKSLRICGVAVAVLKKAAS